MKTKVLKYGLIFAICLLNVFLLKAQDESLVSKKVKKTDVSASSTTTTDTPNPTKANPEKKVTVFIDGQYPLVNSFNIGNVTDFYNYRASVITGSNSTTYSIGQSPGFYAFEFGLFVNSPNKDSSLYSSAGFAIGFEIYNYSSVLEQDQIGYGQFLTFEAEPVVINFSFPYMIPMSKKSYFTLQGDILVGSISAGKYEEIYGGGNPSERDYTISGTSVGFGLSTGIAIGGAVKVFTKIGYRYMPIPLTFTDTSTNTSKQFAVTNTNTSAVTLDLSGFYLTIGLLL